MLFNEVRADYATFSKTHQTVTAKQLIQLLWMVHGPVSTVLFYDRSVQVKVCFINHTLLPNSHYLSKF